MPEIYTAVSITLQFFESVIYAKLLSKLMQRRRNVPIVIIALAAFAFQFLKVFAGENIELSCIIQLLADTAVMVIFYKGEVKNSIIYPIIYYDLMLICDGISICVFLLLELWNFQIVQSNELIQVFMAVLSRLILPFLCAVFLKIWPEKTMIRLRLYPIPILVFLVQFYYFPFEKNSLYYTRPERLYILVCIFLGFTMVCLFSAENHRHKQEEYADKLKILCIHDREKLNYINDIKGTYENLTRYIHDARHHLDLVNTYIQTGQTDKAREYLQSTYENLSEIIISYTGNPDVDTIILSKQLTCTEKITIDVTGRLPPVIGWIDTADLCVLLANALSNAIEACAELETAVIEIEFIYRDWLVISVKNPYIRPPLIKGGEYESRKGTGHGLGLKSMEAIVKKYNGHMNIEAKNGIFTLDILLQMKEERGI